MSNESKHKWVKNADFKPEKVMRGYTTTEQHICSVCGCEREKTVGPRRYRMYSYCRSRILFDYNPPCIDWKAERTNHID